MTGEAIVVGGFFSKEARESSYAKVNIGTFPKLPIRKTDASRVVVKNLKKHYERRSMKLLQNVTVTTMQKADAF